MSAFLLGTGFRADMGTCIRKLVLLKLIDACEDDGSRIFPAIATVARAAQCSERQVQREIRAFLEIGLLSLVREGGKGRRSTNEYALDLDVLSAISKAGWDAFAAARAPSAGGGGADDAGAKGDTVSPLESAPKGDTDGPDRVTPATPKGDTWSRTTPPDSSIDSSIDPSEERARERDAGEGQAEPDQPPAAPAETPGRADFDKRVQRFCSGAGYLAGTWPEWDRVALGWIASRFGDLSPAERAEAERWRDAYLLDCRDRKSKPMGVGVFLRDRAWNALDPILLERTERLRVAKLPESERAKPDGWAACLGPVGMARLFAELLGGPAGVQLTPGHHWSEHRLKADWPLVHQWKALQQMRGGVVFGEQWHALKPQMEAVPAGTAMHEAWRAAFADRGWPWLSCFEGPPVLWAPKGGPDGLERFEAVVRGKTNGGQEAVSGTVANGETDNDGGGREAAE